MADLDALRSDLVNVLKVIPPEVVKVVADLAGKVLNEHRDKLPAIAAYAYAVLQPHAKALGLELASGMTDVKELEPVLSGALESVLNGTNAGQAG